MTAMAGAALPAVGAGFRLIARPTVVGVAAVGSAVAARNYPRRCSSLPGHAKWSIRVTVSCSYETLPLVGRTASGPDLKVIGMADGARGPKNVAWS